MGRGVRNAGSDRGIISAIKRKVDPASSICLPKKKNKRRGGMAKGIVGGHFDRGKVGF